MFVQFNFCLLCLLLNCKTVFGLNKSLRVNDECQKNAVPEKWLSEIFFEARAKFKMDSTVDLRCKNDWKTSKLHSQNHTVWAIRSMYYFQNVFQIFCIGSVGVLQW